MSYLSVDCPECGGRAEVDEYGAGTGGTYTLSCVLCRAKFAVTVEVETLEVPGDDEPQLCPYPALKAWRGTPYTEIVEAAGIDWLDVPVFFERWIEWAGEHYLPRETAADNIRRYLDSCMQHA